MLGTRHSDCWVAGTALSDARAACLLGQAWRTPILPVDGRGVGAQHYSALILPAGWGARSGKPGT